MITLADYRQACRRGLTALSLMLCPMALAAADAPTADAIIEAYLAGVTVDAELAYVETVTYNLAEPDAPTRRYRLLAAMHRGGPDAFRTLLRLVRPPELEGTSLLSIVENGSSDNFLVMPELSGARKIEGRAGTSGSFLGTDFTYEDLKREIPGELRYAKQGNELVNGSMCHVIRAFPTDPERSQYQYRDLYIEHDVYLLHQIDFYYTEGEVGKTLELHGYGSDLIKGESVRPRKAVMTHHANESVTIFTTIAGRQNADLSAETFTPDTVAAMTPEDVRQLIFANEFQIILEPADGDED